MTLSKNFIKDWVIPVLIAVILAIIINKFLFFKIKVPTPSMDPTIKVDDNIYVTRIYNFNNIKRGDILVFNSDELNELLVKRVIGLPGERVEVKSDGTVWINNKELSEPYVKYPGGKTGLFEVPEGKFFFMGDNRANSYDGRSWKDPYISTKDIRGKARITVFPFNRIGVFK